MNLKINNTYKQTAIKMTMMAIIGIALLLTTIALSSLPYYYNSLARAQMKNQTSGHGVIAAGNLTTLTTKSNSSNATTSTNATVGNKTAGKYP
jgi:hypothetical protein